uniref:Uncharacterized protein n=1 Tax=Trichogramma kaykai TaxID=54128 RepID=A0ABD2WC44_9HYME
MFGSWGSSSGSSKCTFRTADHHRQRQWHGIVAVIASSSSHHTGTCTHTHTSVKERERKKKESKVSASRWATSAHAPEFRRAAAAALEHTSRGDYSSVYRRAREKRKIFTDVKLVGWGTIIITHSSRIFD